MSVLTKDEIIDHIKKGELIRNPIVDANGQYEVEPASYDLHAGMIIWKEEDIVAKRADVKSKLFKPAVAAQFQESISLQPGQVMFVITHEDVVMPKTMCGTVYAKNKFSRDGILALTTGHVDPGVDCPIVIRLINLRSIPYTFSLGEPIYTIVFHKLQPNSWSTWYEHPKIERKDTIKRTIESADAALGNALNDISLTREFVRKDEFNKLIEKSDKYVLKEECGKEALKFLTKTFWFWVTVVFAVLGAIAAIAKVLEWMSKKST